LSPVPLEAPEIGVEIDLHGVARGPISVAGEHGPALGFHGRSHLLRRRQGQPAGEVIAYESALGFGDGHDGTEGL